MMILEDFYTYREMCTIFYEKFKATPDEVRYWVKGTSEERKRNHTAAYLPDLRRYKCDVPLFVPDDEYLFSHLMNRRFIDIDEEEDFPLSFFPEYNFYLREDVDYFKPHIARFVYLKDLPSKRNWNDYEIAGRKILSENFGGEMVEKQIEPASTYIENLLKKANNVGILRLYDKQIDDFTLTQPRFSPSTNQYEKITWRDLSAFTVENHFSNPDSFFLLFDIITIERQFFGKPRELCFKELFPNTEFKEENDINEEEPERNRIKEVFGQIKGAAKTTQRGGQAIKPSQ